VAGTVRFLKNVMGLWILDNCHKEWAEAGRDLPHGELTARVAAAGGPIVVLDPDDQRFLAPRSMLAELRTVLAEQGQPSSDEPVAVAKLVLDSLAWRYAQIVERIEALTGDPVRGIHIVGGGSLNDYLNQATADASGRPVLAGPVEATALGNLMLQAIAYGRFANLAAARARLADDSASRPFAPRKGTGWERLRGAIVSA